ncbi:MAG: tetratricopeptide repeat protein [Alphaproteobacteria bacterium]|nr:tetratricopeptide repeat protein [Alphaproteobacteria bacterium]
MRNFLAALLVLGLVVLPSPSKAAQDDPRLDELFVQLKAETDPEEARTIEDNIWLLWIESGDAGTDRLFDRGREALIRGDMEIALAIGTEITGRAPNFAEGWYMCSTILYQMGNVDHALRYAQKAIKLEPRHFPALMGIGVIHLQQGHDEEALMAFRQALDVDPHLTQAHQIMDELTKRLNDKQPPRSRLPS